MTRGTSLEKRVACFLREKGLTGRTVVVAVSGGPDSLALLLALDRLRGPLGLELHVAHLDHGLRIEGRAEAAYVRRVAARLGLPVTVGREEVEAYRRIQRLSQEEAARRVRYVFLGRVARDCDAAAVLTGHTADDQAETVLLHILRGAGLAGLRGMKPLAHLSFPQGDEAVAVAIARPLLTTWRHETEAYCQQRRFRPRLDLSNLDRGHLRNRLRLDLLPQMEEARPGAAEALLSLARAASQAEEYLERAAGRAWRSGARREGSFIILERAALLTLHPTIRATLLRRAARMVAGDPPPLEQVHMQAIEELLQKPSGRSVDLPRGLRFTTWYSQAVLGLGPPPCPLPVLEAGPLAVPGETLRGGWRFQVRRGGGILRLTAAPANGRPPTPVSLLPRPLTASLAGEGATTGLYVRSRRPGDRVHTPGGTRKVQDLLVDAKIPRAWRDRVPLVCHADTGEVLWVVGAHSPSPPPPLPCTLRNERTAGD